MSAYIRTRTNVQRKQTHTHARKLWITTQMRSENWRPTIFKGVKMPNYRKQNAWNCFEFLPDAMLAVHLYSDRWSSMSMICVLWRDICWWNSTMKIMTLRIECDLYLWMDSMCYLVAPLVAARVLIDLYSDYSNCPWNLQITFLIMNTMKKNSFISSMN